MLAARAALSSCAAAPTHPLPSRLRSGHDREDMEVGLPAEVPLPERCVALAAGYFHTLCLGESGAVWAFGCNGKGQLGARGRHRVWGGVGMWVVVSVACSTK